jgi:hypothetical protein
MTIFRMTSWLAAPKPRRKPSPQSEVAPTLRCHVAAIPGPTFHRLALPWEAAFLAGKCLLAYRKRGGARSSPLPEFYIGGHASVSGMKLLTRDAARYRTYFPKLRLIAP